MRSAVRSSFEFLSMSTLDLFASILGTFVLITFVLLPYYLRQPSLERDIAQAEAETSAVAEELRLQREKLRDQAARSEAERTLAAAQDRLASARALAAAQATPKEEKKPAPSPLPTPFAIRDLDLVFVIDTTGSMRHELADMQANLIGVINILNRLSSSLRIGVVAYKDRGERYITRDFPLRPMEGAEVGQILDFVRGLEASGGGDDPEPVDLALKVAIDMPWRADAQGRIIVIGDALARIARPRSLWRRSSGIPRGSRIASRGIGDLCRRRALLGQVLRTDRNRRRRRVLGQSGADHRERAVVGPAEQEASSGTRRDGPASSTMKTRGQVLGREARR